MGVSVVGRPGERNKDDQVLATAVVPGKLYDVFFSHSGEPKRSPVDLVRMRFQERHPTLEVFLDEKSLQPGCPNIGARHGAVSGTWIQDDPQQELRLKRRLLLARSVAAGMRHLHKQSLVHSDLKPQNILTSSKAILSEEFVRKGGCMEELHILLRRWREARAAGSDAPQQADQDAPQAPTRPVQVLPVLYGFTFEGLLGMRVPHDSEEWCVEGDQPTVHWPAAADRPAWASDLEDALLKLTKHRTDQDGRTPLHYAAQNGHADAVRALLEAGAGTGATPTVRRHDGKQLHGDAQLRDSVVERTVELLQKAGQLPAGVKLTREGCSGLTLLPEPVGQLSSLQKLDLLGCSRLTALPESVGQPSSLQWLNLQDCRGLTTLPERLGQLSSLQKLATDRKAVAAMQLEVDQVLGPLRSLSLQPSRTHAPAATLAYAIPSPDHTRSFKASLQHDVYAFGILLYLISAGLGPCAPTPETTKGANNSVHALAHSNLQQPPASFKLIATATGATLSNAHCDNSYNANSNSDAATRRRAHNSNNVKPHAAADHGPERDVQAHAAHRLPGAAAAAA